jgi:hypothetical protein
MMATKIVYRCWCLSFKRVNMQRKIWIYAIFFAVISTFSCTKESIKSYPIEGLWLGTYTVDALPGSGERFYSLVVYPDGKLLTKSKSSDGNDYYSSGSWTMSSDNNFKGTVTTFYPISGSNAVTQEITATYSKAGQLTNGIWRDTVNPFTKHQGKFSTLQRVN